MKEHELLHRAMNAYGLDREAIRQAARCRGAARLHKGGTSMKRKWTAAAAVLAACLCPSTSFSFKEEKDQIPAGHLENSGAKLRFAYH